MVGDRRGFDARNIQRSSTTSPYRTRYFAMTTPTNTERTTILARYSTRHDAEVARDALKHEGLRAMISADDGGGMYVQMQYTNGVKLHVPEGEANEARRVLGSANMLPDGTTAQEKKPESSNTFAQTVGAAFIGVSVLLVLVGAATFRMDAIVGAGFVGIAGWMMRTMSART